MGIFVLAIFTQAMAASWCTVASVWSAGDVNVTDLKGTGISVEMRCIAWLS